MRFLLFGIVFFMEMFWVFSNLQAQTDSTLQTSEDTRMAEEPKTHFLTVSGYLKELSTPSMMPSFRNFQYNNLIHNRLNSVWNFSKKLILKAELRTRIFTGYTVRNFPGYAAYLDHDNAWADMSWVLVNRKDIILHSTLDRLYLNYTRKKWELSIGRQRINWGRTYVWNPNDLFNTYSYLDFDYEERPGTDAVRFQYYTGYASGVELAIAPRETWDKTVAAFMWKFNRWNYDFQILGGNVRTNLALGLGWAGSIKGVGFKGEMTYFHPRGAADTTSGFLNACVGLDYVFRNSLQVQAEFLYNGNWRGNLNPAILLVQPLPATNLFPGREVVFVGANYQVHPLVNLSASGILSPGSKLYIFVPGITISIFQNVDLLLTMQLLRNRELEQVSPNSNLLYGRLKWSF